MTHMEELNGHELTLWGSFAAPHMETLYRASQARHDRRQVAIVLAMVMTVATLFIPSDYKNLGPTPLFQILLGARVTMSALAAMLLIVIRRGLRPATQDKLLFTWMLMGSTVMFSIGASRTGQYFPGYALSEVLGILLVYVAMPVPLRMQITVTLLATLGDAVLIAFGGGSLIDPLFRRTLIAGYGVVHLVGLFSSWNLNRVKREQFAALQRETRLRENLEEAVNELKTLRGIVPICSYCKRIRDDAGFWQQVEAYVTAHTGAQFSHAICPHCEAQAEEDLLKG